uniref:Sigma-54 factor interaction domain-containing protein n=1 Tax=Leptospirillum ferriphilum TaxID=178606 RepID=A0A7C3QT53_9BACT
MRDHERLSLDIPVTFRASTGGFRKGTLTNLSLTGCFIRPVRKSDIDGWVRIRIHGRDNAGGEGPETIETWGFVTRLEEEGFGVHFNWIERNNLRRFGEFLLHYAPDSPAVRKLLEVNGASFQFLSPSSGTGDCSVNGSPLEGGIIENLLRESWSSFLEHSPSHFFDGMIEWISGLVVEKEQAPPTFDWCSDWFFLGNSPQIHEIIQKIQIVAPSGLPILLLGETGVGKEMFARLCHELGANRPGPFLPVNCGAIPYELSENLFFGHEKGSFSGADSRNTGYLEAAAGGTLFLDEIGELPLPLQVKLLRVLQEKKFCRVGSVREVPFDARIVCATNKNMKEEVLKGKFREDLFYRLDGLSLRIPPLRERISDVLPMARYLLSKITKNGNLPARTIGPEAARAIHSYHWPGNVRELHNVIYRAAIIADRPEIREEDLGLPIEQSSQEKPTLRELREIFEKEIVLESLIRHNGNVARVALELEISKPSVYHFIKKHKLPTSFSCE